MDYTNAMMVWDAVSVRITDVRHGAIAGGQSELTGENGLFDIRTRQGCARDHRGRAICTAWRCSVSRWTRTSRAPGHYRKGGIPLRCIPCGSAAGRRTGDGTPALGKKPPSTLRSRCVQSILLPYFVPVRPWRVRGRKRRRSSSSCESSVLCIAGRILRRSVAIGAQRGRRCRGMDAAVICVCIVRRYFPS